MAHVEGGLDVVSHLVLLPKLTVGLHSLKNYLQWRPMVNKQRCQSLVQTNPDLLLNHWRRLSQMREERPQGGHHWFWQVAYLKKGEKKNKNDVINRGKSSREIKYNYNIVLLHFLKNTIGHPDHQGFTTVVCSGWGGGGGGGGVAMVKNGEK